MLAPSLAPLVGLFAQCFTAPSFTTFQHLVAGWVLCLGRHTVTGVLQASGAVGRKHHTSFLRFFRAAAWMADDVGLRMAHLVLRLVPRDEPVIVALDDTLGRHTGSTSVRRRCIMIRFYQHAPKRCSTGVTSG
jgi:hypothetical protein